MFDHVAERAVATRRPGGAREKFVPGGKRRPLAVDPDRNIGRPGLVRARPDARHQRVRVRRQKICHRAVLRGLAQRIQRARFAARGLRRIQKHSRFVQFHGNILPGGAFPRGVSRPCCPKVTPSHDGKSCRARPVKGDRPVPGIVGFGAHRMQPAVGAEYRRPDHIMAVAEDIRGYVHRHAGNGLGREATAVDQGIDAFDDEPTFREVLKFQKRIPAGPSRLHRRTSFSLGPGLLVAGSELGSPVRAHSRRSTRLPF